MEVLTIWILFGVVAAATASRNGRTGCGWFLLGIIFGPFALIVALLPSSKEKDTSKAYESGSYGEYKKCPFCAEVIKKEAIKWKHCSSDLQQRR